MKTCRAIALASSSCAVAALVLLGGATPAAASTTVRCDDAAAGLTVTVASGGTQSLNISIMPMGSGPYSGGCKIAVVTTNGSNSYETSWGTGAGTSGTPTETVMGTITPMTTETISDGADSVSAYVWDSGSGLYDFSAGTSVSSLRLWVAPTGSGWAGKVVGTVTTSLTASSAPNSPSVGTSSGVSAGPPAWLQQFATDKDDDCSTPPADLDLGPTHVTGGWGKSWAQWANDRSGGWVCTRTLVHEASSGTWSHS